MGGGSHLHVSCYMFDTTTGEFQSLPFAFSNVVDLAGNPLPGVLTGGTSFNPVPRLVLDLDPRTPPE